MRSTLLLPPRRSWPIAAAQAGRAYEWKRHMPEIPPAVTAYRLPDGRYRLQVEGLIPVVISRALYAACTEHPRWAMVRLLAAHAVFFCTDKDLRVPWRSARFVQCGEEFFLEDEAIPYPYAQLRVPMRSVIAGA